MFYSDMYINMRTQDVRLNVKSERKNQKDDLVEVADTRIKLKRTETKWSELAEEHRGWKKNGETPEGTENQ
ncbi:hypothetical protein RUM43_003631 [Polyplax serrata]|uniref:Uncharacterized protein n=1 Tax=Polyplax serrata TaxID=468196 RepID=A0AAN8S9F4_POLSC